MALAHAPRVVTDGLVFYYDMSNTQKSWKGAPTTNLVTSQDISSYSRTGLVGAPTGGIEAPDKSPTAYKIVGNTDSADYDFVSIPASQPTGPLAVSCYMKAAGYSTGSLFLTQGGNHGALYDLIAGTATSTGGTGNTCGMTSVGNGWWWCWIANSGTTSAGFRIGPQTGAYQAYAGNGASGIYAWHPQVEQSTFATPYINGTRSNTQAILDLTGNNTLTASSLTYNSDNTFSFNGTSDVISTGTLPYQFLNTGVTISVAFRYTQTTTNDNLISWGNSAFNSLLSYSWELRIRGAGNVEFSPGVFTSGTAPARMSYTPTIALNGRDVIMDVVYTANGNAYIYENGVAMATYNYAGVGLYNNTQLLRVGRGTDTNFPGKIYSTKIYNRPLSALEIKQNFNATRGRYGI